MNGDDSAPKAYSAAEIYSWLRCYLVTHAHLDHVNGAVLSAGSLSGPPRKIHAAYQTLKDIETIFSDRLWPNLTSWDEEDHQPFVALLYSELSLDGHYQPISCGMSVRTMPLSHGRYPSSSSVYESSAFFIRHDASAEEFLFFGDVEADIIAGDGRNQAVWDIAAEMIPHSLSTIFLECSWPMGRPDVMLYGHLNPEHLVEELANLAATVWKVRNSDSGTEDVGGRRREEDTESTSILNSPRHARKRQKRNHTSPPSGTPEPDQLRGMLDGVRVVIIHCKDDIRGEYDRPVNLVIADQVRELVDERGLGAEIVAAVQGMCISI